jgi:hypothetical protein
MFNFRTSITLKYLLTALGLTVSTASASLISLGSESFISSYFAAQGLVVLYVVALAAEYLFPPAA